MKVLIKAMLIILAAIKKLRELLRQFLHTVLPTVAHDLIDRNNIILDH